MNLDRVIAVRNKKTIYRDGDRCIKVFSEDYSKADVLNEALNQARIEETGLNIPRIHEVCRIDGQWVINPTHEQKAKSDIDLLYAGIRGKFRSRSMEDLIEEAKQLLLKDRHASTNIIAEACGFSDRSNFHRQFVKIVGCSPKQWRDSDGKITSEQAL